jgi:hypothetical protein
MKIEKGYTLSQFVDYVGGTDRPFFNKEEPDGGMGEMADCMAAVSDYNKFLKQPLKKEMFVNESHKPNKSLKIYGGFTDNELYKKQLKRWQEAENKLIFDKIVLKEENNIGLTKVYINEAKIAHYWEKCGNWLCLYETLHDLFEAIPNLPLKNVEL